MKHIKTALLYIFLLLFFMPLFAQDRTEIKVLQVLNRFYVQDIDKAVNFYENLLGTKCSLRFEYKEAKLELAQVGNILILAGSEKALEPFKDTKATFVVNSIENIKKYLLENGAIIIRDIKQVPTGKNLTAKNADGTIIEYVELKKE